MKTKAIKEGLRENDPHCVCQKSTLISKNSHSSRWSSLIPEVDTSIYQDVSPSTQVTVKDIRRDEAIDHGDLLDAIAEDSPSQKQNPGSIDPTITEIMEFPAANCLSKFETTCSPALDWADLNNLTNVFNDAVSRVDPDMPQLLAEDSDDSGRIPCEYQTCNISDYAIYDTISTVNGSNNDINWKDFYSDYQGVESTRLSDISEHYMLPSFLEDAEEKSNIQDAKSSIETATEFEASGLNLAIEKFLDHDSDSKVDSPSGEFERFDPGDIIKYLSDASIFWSSLSADASNFWSPLSAEDTCNKSIIQDVNSLKETLMVSDATGLNLAEQQLKSCDQNFEAKLNLYSDQVECFDPDDIIKYLSDASNFWTPLSPNKKCTKKSITLVLDLDETLVHSTVDHCTIADFTFPVFFKMKEHVVYVKQRPFLHTFLERVAEMFQIVVFTASESIYAKPLLDILDPEGKLIGQRFYRESCIFSDGNCTKDLTVIGVELPKVAIVDNSPQVFRLQVNNGIPINSWFDDPSDRALLSLLPFLETLAEADDVRPVIANRYSNK